MAATPDHEPASSGPAARTRAVVTGPDAESQEVLADYWIVECDSFDRATEIPARLSGCPAPEQVRARAYADVRPIDQHLTNPGA